MLVAPVLTILWGIASMWICAGLGKRVGDEIVTWVISHDFDREAVDDFGLEVRSTRWGARFSLDKYGPHVERYRELRSERGEGVELATRFDRIALCLWLLPALSCVIFLGIAARHWLMGTA